MKQNNNFSVALGVSALVIAFISLFVISYDLIQIVNFLLTCKAEGLSQY
jgi:hypothetical protein